VKRVMLMVCLLAGLAVAVSACGSKEASIVDRAFKNHIDSAQMTFRVTVQQNAKKAQAFTVQGPFKNNGAGQIPSFDLQVNAADQFKGELISSGKDLFVRYKGETYDIGQDKVAQFQKQMAAKSKQQGDVNSVSDFSKLGIDLSKWFPQTSVKQDAQAAGVPTTRVSGRLDISRALADFAKLLHKPQFKSQIGGAGQITDAQVHQIAALVSDPRFALDVGRADGKLRQITAHATIKGQAKLAMLLELRDVDKPVSIDAPSSGRPIQELLSKITGGVKQQQGA
jgi:hypothetical protein